MASLKAMTGGSARNRNGKSKNQRPRRVGPEDYFPQRSGTACQLGGPSYSFRDKSRCTAILPEEDSDEEIAVFEPEEAGEDWFAQSDNAQPWTPSEESVVQSAVLAAACTVAAKAAMDKVKAHWERSAPQCNLDLLQFLYKMKIKLALTPGPSLFECAKDIMRHENAGLDDPLV